MSSGDGAKEPAALHVQAIHIQRWLCVTESHKCSYAVLNFDFRTEWEPLYCTDLRRHVNCVIDQSGENEYNVYYVQNAM